MRSRAYLLWSWCGRGYYGSQSGGSSWRRPLRIAQVGAPYIATRPVTITLRASHSTASYPSVLPESGDGILLRIAAARTSTMTNGSPRPRITPKHMPAVRDIRGQRGMQAPAHLDPSACTRACKWIPSRSRNPDAPAQLNVSAITRHAIRMPCSMPYEYRLPRSLWPAVHELRAAVPPYLHATKVSARKISK